MRLKTLTAALTAAVLAVGMAACNRDNAGAGSSAQQGMTKQRSGAAGSSSAPSAPTAPSPYGNKGSSSAPGSSPSGSSDSSSSSSSK